MKRNIVFACLVSALGLAFGQEDYFSWSAMKSVTINTTASGGGADVANGVANFPVLVRLTSSQADVFAQSSANGADIRFTSADGLTRLKHQRERWDSAGQAAEFWVLVPGVAGNANTTIRMFWGKGGASDSSSGGAVFDTANKFQAVWHMNAGGTGNESDATVNGFTLSAPTAAPTNNPSAVIGTARSFASSSSQYLVALNTAGSALSFPQGGPFTLSAWINPTTNGQRVIVCKGDYQYALQTAATSFPIEGVEFESGTGWRNVQSPAPATGTWSYLAFVRDAAAESLYVNGALVNSTPNLSASAQSRNTGYNVFVGALIAGTAPGTTSSGTKSRYWNGSIDEVILSSSPRGADWIKLSYETQKSGATAVTLGATQAPGPLAPANLSYSQNPAVYTVGSAITNNTPTVTGTVTAWSVAPALPAGLTLNASTGVISGTPTAATAQAGYVVTATNSAGSTTANLSLTVNAAPTPPSNLSYSLNPAAYTVGTAVANNTPTVTGTVASYSVSPALPAGLSLNTTTGVISGTPTAATAQANYTVTATNAAGSTTVAVSITVNPQAPTSLSYSPSTVIDTVNRAVSPMTPAVTGTVTSYSVSPALPAGLSLNTTTGVISGTPTAATAQANYTVTATNAGGSTTAVITLTVVQEPSAIGPQALQGSFSVRTTAQGVCFRLPAGHPAARITVMDLWGRSVWSGKADEGTPEIIWDGLTQGRRASGGVYLVRMDFPDRSGTARTAEGKILITP